MHACLYVLCKYMCVYFEAGFSMQPLNSQASASAFLVLIMAVHCHTHRVSNFS